MTIDLAALEQLAAQAAEYVPPAAGMPSGVQIREEWASKYGRTYCGKVELDPATVAALVRAYRIAVRAFAQYALKTDDPPEQALRDFEQGFLQDAALAPFREQP